MNENIDDGSLAFLNIKEQDGVKHSDSINLINKYSYGSIL